MDVKGALLCGTATDGVGLMRWRGCPACTPPLFAPQFHETACVYLHTCCAVQSGLRADNFQISQAEVEAIARNYMVPNDAAIVTSQDTVMSFVRLLAAGFACNSSI